MADSDILRGAIQAAAGNTLGLTQDQVLDLKRRQLRDKQRDNRGRRAERAGNEQEAQDFLAEDSRRFESTGSFVEQERYPDPFGIPVSPKDVELDTSLRDEQAFDQQRGVRVFKNNGKGRQEYWRESGENKEGQWVRGKLNANKKIAGRVGYATGIRPDLASPHTKNLTKAPQAAGMGGPNGLATQLKGMVARGEVDPEALVPGSSTKTIRDLIREMDMETDPQLRAKADKLIGKQTAERDAARFSPAVRAINDARSERLGKLGHQVSPAAQVNLGSIGNVQSLGIASKKFNRGSNMSIFNVVPNADGDVIDRDGGIDQMVKYLTEIGEDLPEGRVPQMPGNDAGYRTAQGDVTLADAIRVVQHLQKPGFAGPEGSTIGYTDNQDKFIGDVNLSGADNVANAPISRTATWMEANLPDFGKQQGTSFGARQVNPGVELAMLTERLNNLDNFAPATGIRGIADLENAVFSAIVDNEYRGKGFFEPDPNDPNKQLRVSDPGIDDVLRKAKYTSEEKQRLAAALQSVEAAMLSEVNGLQKELYEAGIPSDSQSTRQVRTIVPVARSVYDGVTGNESDYDYYESQYRSEPRISTGFEKDVQLSRITNETVDRENKKTGVKPTSVRKGLKLLDGRKEVFKKRDPSTIYTVTPEGQSVLLPEAQQDLIDASIALSDAQRPFQAAIEGEQLDTKYRKDPERARFITNTERNPKIYKMTNEERIKAFGPAGGEAANEVIRRAIEDKKIRTAPKPQDAIAAEFRARDSEFEAAGEIRNAADERAIKTASRPSGVRATGQTLLGGQEVPRMKVYDDPKFANTQAVQGQQATSAAVNPPTDPMPLAARGGWMGESSRGQIRSPWDPVVAEPVMAQKAAPMQEPLAGISYNEMAPDPWTTQPATGGGFTQQERRVPASMLNELAELNSGTTNGPRSPSIQDKIMNSIKRAPINFAAAPRRQRYGAAAGAALLGATGLSALIGGERDKREQEQYQ